MLKTMLFWIFAFWLSSGFVVGEESFYLDTPENIRFFRHDFKDRMRRLVGKTTEGTENYKAAKKIGRIQNRIPDDVPFPCNVTAGRSKTVPTSVNKLRPGDIDVIGAMGDSLTAGTGALGTQVFHLFVENRGVTSLGGGQGTWRQFLTIPNIIKEFNPNLVGYSTEDSSTHEEASELNVGDLAALSRDLPFMAETLLIRMRKHPKVDMKNHWKLISIFIGHNDFCSDMCYIPTGPWSVLEKHRVELIKTLRILKKNSPRTLVSLVLPPNLSIALSLKNKPLMCSIAATVECTCLGSLVWRPRKKEFTEIMYRWQQIEEEVASYPEFQTDDFAVVAQPFASKWVYPTNPDGNPDLRFLSVDCFHMSQHGNARVAVNVWRNMLEPVGQKFRGWEEIKTLKCPTESRPYIATAGNS